MCGSFEEKSFVKEYPRFSHGRNLWIKRLQKVAEKWITASMVITITFLYNTPLDQWVYCNWARTCSNNAWAMGGLWDGCSCDQRPGSRQLSECRRQANWQAGRSKCVCHMVLCDSTCHYLVGLPNCIPILCSVWMVVVFFMLFDMSPSVGHATGRGRGHFSNFCQVLCRELQLSYHNCICILFLCGW